MAKLTLSDRQTSSQLVNQRDREGGGEEEKENWEENRSIKGWTKGCIEY